MPYVNADNRELSTPCFRSMAHVITHDTADFYQTHFGCVAYTPDKGVLSFGGKCGPRDKPDTYLCCNRKIEHFNLGVCRQALLEVLLLTSPDNFETFASTLTCDYHRTEGSMWVAWTRQRWFAEMACKRRNWSGYCDCCNIRKPQPRSADGHTQKQRQIPHPLTHGSLPDEDTTESHEPPATVEQPQVKDIDRQDIDFRLGPPSHWSGFVERGTEQLILVGLGVRDVAVAIRATILSLAILPSVAFDLE